MMGSDEGDMMCIVLFHNGPILGPQLLATWQQLASQSTEIGILNDCSLDELEQVDVQLVILASDMLSEFEQSVLDKCRSLQIPVLPVLGRGTTAFLGPFETPGVPGCATCLQLRWENSFERSVLQHFFGQQSGTLIEELAEPFEMSAMAMEKLFNLVVQEIQSILQPEGMPHARGHVCVYSDEHAEWVPVLPNHDCPRCGLIPDDHPALAQLEFASCALADEEALRVKNIDFEQLKRMFFHSDVGYISVIHKHSDDTAFAQAAAFIYTPAGAEIAGYGSGPTSTAARQSAMLEVLERSCGFQAVNRKPIVFGRYAEFAENAIHPSRFGLHCYELLPSTYSLLEPFDEEKRYSWVWAYSTRQNIPVLIPEQMAYYGPTADERRFVTESSNGCAIGGSVEEAVLHGIFEVLERDGFLNMWYAKQPVPELTIGAHCPAQTAHMLHTLDDMGYEVRLFQLSPDLDIPVVCAVGIHRLHQYPKVVSGSACHINPYQAVHGALRELTVQVFNLRRSPEARRNQARAMFKDPRTIRDILDHNAVAALPEAYPRWAFLLECTRQRPVQSVEETYMTAAARYQLASRDIRLILDAVVRDLHHRGFDVVVVQQTSAELSYAGLSAVKVLVPGMTPITWGYGLQRVRGLSRLFELPYRLGYAARILTEDDLNPDSHPFS